MTKCKDKLCVEHGSNLARMTFLINEYSQLARGIKSIFAHWPSHRCSISHI